MSTGLNVLRYSALVFGIGYGILHRQTLQVQYDSDSLKKEIQKRESWQHKAAAAWKAKNANNDGLITDPDAPGFDLEALFKHYEK